MRKFFCITILFVFLTGCSVFTIQPCYAPVKNGYIEYYSLGAGHPVILIPGYGTDVSCWDKYFVVELAKKNRVIVINNRNVGGSIVQSKNYLARDLAEDIYQLICDLHLEKPVVIGISMGGMIAQQLAVLHPHEMGKLILINTVIAGKRAVHPSMIVEERLKNMPKYKVARYVRALDLFFPPAWRMQMAYALAFNRFQPKGYQEIKLNQVIPQQQKLVMNWIDDNSAAKQLASLPVPVLILNGEKDNVIPPINSLILARTLPHATLWRWQEGGHAMIYQYPQQMANMINQFIG